MKTAEDRVRERLANNGRNAANGNAGIPVGSDLHLCEMLLAEIDRLKLLVYSNLGDNHHNARDCPYCQGKAAVSATECEPEK